jgi:hypothetical protein
MPGGRVSGGLWDVIFVYILKKKTPMENGKK